MSLQCQSSSIWWHSMEFNLNLVWINLKSPLRFQCFGKTYEILLTLKDIHISCFLLRISYTISQKIWIFFRCKIAYAMKNFEKHSFSRMHFNRCFNNSRIFWMQNYLLKHWILRKMDNGKKGLCADLLFIECVSMNFSSWNQWILLFCYFVLCIRTSMCNVHLSACMHLFLSASLCVYLCYLWFVSFRFDSFCASVCQCECMFFFSLHSLLLQLKIRCFCSVEWLIVWCALLPICYLFDKIDKSHRAQCMHIHIHGFQL